jgi:hypothetical protein
MSNLKSKIQKISVPTLISFQQVIETASREMYSFFQKLIEEEKDGKISKEFLKKIEDRLESAVEKNNIYGAALEKEIYSRIKKEVSEDITTSEVMKGLIDEYHEEAQNKASNVKKQKFESANKADLKKVD